jgi:hypothetical protein
VTQAFLNDLKETRQGTLEAWGRGNLTKGSTDETVQLNAEAIGGVGAIASVIDQIEAWQELETDEVERVTA